MKIFDMHADIGYDVMEKKKQGIQHVVRDVHQKKFKAGEIAYVGMASYFEGNESWEDMQEMVTTLRMEILACDEIDLVLNEHDLLSDTGHTKALLTIEGMCGIREDAINKLHWLYDQGVRVASLCWNDENALATGVRGNPKQGLTEMGIDLVKEMIRLRMVIDVSHTNETTFWDMMALEPELIIATHSNARALCDHPRNLSDDQIMAIQERGGVIGMNSAPMFVDEEEALQDVAHLVHHARYISELAGVEHVAIGFDYMDFYEGYEYNMDEMPDCTLAQKFVKQLTQQAFSESECKAICYQNALRVIAKAYQ